MFPTGAQSVCFEPFTLLGKQAMVYAQRNSLRAEILCAAPAPDEYAQILLYQRALLSGSHTYMLILYSEFTYPLAFAYGLAKALGIPCRKKRVR